MADQLPKLSESDLTSLVDQKNRAQMIKQYIIIELSYRKILWFVSVSQILYLPKPSALVNNNIDLLATNKSQYLAQPCSITVNSFFLLDSIVSVVCAKPAKSDVMDATKRDFFHWINFLFVKGDFQVSLYTKTYIIEPLAQTIST